MVLPVTQCCLQSWSWFLLKFYDHWLFQIHVHWSDGILEDALWDLAKAQEPSSIPSYYGIFIGLYDNAIAAVCIVFIIEKQCEHVNSLALTSDGARTSTGTVLPIKLDLIFAEVWMILNTCPLIWWYDCRWITRSCKSSKTEFYPIIVWHVYWWHYTFYCSSLYCLHSRKICDHIYSSSNNLTNFA